MHDDDHLTDDERALAERGRSVVAAAVAQTSAPLVLRERVEREREAAARRGGRRAPWHVLVPGGGLVAAAAVAVALVLGGGGGPTVADVAALSLRAPTADVPPHQGVRLPVAVDGVAFPDWSAVFPWDATGQRADRVDGRDARTVFYDDPRGVRLGYTIVSGAALEAPAGRDVRRDGDAYRVTRRGGRTLVVWRRGGHTCVISAPATVPPDRLVTLAAWA